MAEIKTLINIFFELIIKSQELIELRLFIDDKRKFFLLKIYNLAKSPATKQALDKMTNILGGLFTKNNCKT